MSDKYPGGFVTANAPAGFSVALNGSSDYLTAANNAAFLFGTGDFTIEAWVYATSLSGSTNNTIACVWASGQNAWFLGINSSNSVIFGYAAGSTYTFSNTFTTNTWYHIAVARSGTSLKAFVNGVQVGTTQTNSTNITSTALLSVGANLDAGPTQYWNGYVSNLRLIKGTALYTTTFTPPTQLFPIANTSLLTCQSPTIIDNSINTFAITVNSTAKTSNFTPFAAYQGFNPALGAAAGGVWTLDEAAYYQNNRQWPIYDPYFNQTTLMLHGNGTNGAQNNTFLDSSSSPLTITRNGNTTQGSFSPFSQTGWSYNGTAGAYCQLNNADYAIGTGDFTIEFWMYCVDDSTYGSSAFAGLTGAGTLTVSMSGGSSNARQPYLEFGGTSTAFGTLYGYLNKWTHIAYVRRSGFVTVYQNGVATSAPVSRTQSFPNCANLYLARLPTDTAQDFRGYMSNYRITKAAVYSSNFTPSTTPLVPVSNTVLLTFQDNRFVDNSALRATVTPAGTASVQAFSPFVPAYITPTTYSNWFDGTGDYLTWSGSTVGAGEFTFECWFNSTNFGASQTLFGPNGTTNGGFGINVSSSTSISIDRYGVSADNFTVPTMSTNTWYYIVVVRNSSNVTTVFLNGIRSSTGTATIAYTFGNVGAIGYTSSAVNRYFFGAISNARYVNTAIYDPTQTTINIPTAPLTAISGTQLLTCQSSTLIDNSTNNFTLTAYGNLQPVTSPTPFPAKVDTTTLNSAYSTSLIGGSAYFDGTGDYLSLANNAALFPGTGDFTMEFWINPTVLSGNQMIWGQNANGLDIYRLSSTGKLVVDQANVGTIVSSTANVIANAWAHYAVTRSGTSVKLFVNGVLDATATNSANLTNSNNPAIGASPGGSGNFYTGYIAGLRFVKGTALYTSSFAIPASPPTAVTNTQLLTNFTNAGIYDNTAKNVLETVGNAQISTTQSKWGGTSMSFPATNGNYAISPPNQQNFLFGTGQFTIEAWVYPTAFTNSAAGLFSYGVAGGYIDWNLELNTSGTVSYIDNNAIRFSSSSNLTLNTWTHVCLARTSSTVTLYFNGVSVGTYSTINNISGGSTSAQLYVGTGAQIPGSRQFIGYIDDFRITKGVARYVTSFTPPTSQLQDQ